MTAPTADQNELLRAARLLMATGGVREVRALNVDRYGTVSGYSDLAERVAEMAMELDRLGAPAVYITLNECNPALQARASHRLQHRAKITTSDNDIVRRRWLLVDFDPKRPAGISSTDAEHRRAISSACGAWDDLRGSLGDPVVCDSGNGAHLLYPLDLPSTVEATELVRQRLASIARWSAPDDVEVDLSVFNASRITKLYGTVARKGDHTPQRPHRLSRILEIPSGREIS
jgi:hypothetical protein